MMRSSTPAERVGEHVATALGALEARLNAQSAQARRRLFDAANAHVVRHRTYRWPGMLALGMAVTTLTFGLFLWHRHVESPRFYVDGKPSEVRGFVAASTARPSQLRFVDGSHMDLTPESAMRVLEVGDHGATVNLEHGKVQADIVPRTGNDWHVTAGPFTVQVIGTRFNVDWDVAKGQLTLAVERGRIAVWGSFISKREVVAGHVLVADVRASSVVESGSIAPLVDPSSRAIPVTELPPITEAPWKR